MRTGVGQSQTNQDCISPERARNPLQGMRQMMPQGQAANCRFTDEVFAGGVIRIRATCPGPGGGAGGGQMSLEGSFTATTLQATLSVRAQGANPAMPGATGMNMSAEVRAAASAIVPPAHGRATVSESIGRRRGALFSPLAAARTGDRGGGAENKAGGSAAGNSAGAELGAPGAGASGAPATGAGRVGNGDDGDGARDARRTAGGAGAAARAAGAVADQSPVHHSGAGRQPVAGYRRRLAKRQLPVRRHQLVRRRHPDPRDLPGARRRGPGGDGDGGQLHRDHARRQALGHRHGTEHDRGARHAADAGHQHDQGPPLRASALPDPNGGRRNEELVRRGNRRLAARRLQFAGRRAATAPPARNGADAAGNAAGAQAGRPVRPRRRPPATRTPNQFSRANGK